MEYIIIKPNQQAVLNNLFQGNIISNSYYTKELFIECQNKHQISKRHLPIKIRTTLEFIEMLIDFYTPSNYKYFEDTNSNKISYGELIHLDLITNTEIYDNNTKYQGIFEEKHIIQYYNEIFAIIKQNNPIRTLNEKFNSLIESLSKYIGFSDRFQQYVIDLLNINFFVIEKEVRTPFETDYFSLIELLSNTINPKYKQLSKDLDSFIAGIDPITLSWIIEHKTFPPIWDETKKLKMRNDSKADIVRFADFFGFSIAQINRLFTPKVDSNNRNTVSREGINRILNKYPTLKKNI